MSSVSEGSDAGTSGKRRLRTSLMAAAIASVFLTPLLGFADLARAQSHQPNIIFIMGDDIGWSNIGVYNQGIMAGRTPNLDRMASEAHAVYRLLRRGELHCRSGKLHHWRVTDPAPA